MSITLKQISERSAKVTRLIDGRPMVGASPTPRQLTQLLLDNACVVRSSTMGDRLINGDITDNLCRIVALSTEIAKVAGIDLEIEMGRRLPKVKS